MTRTTPTDFEINQDRAKLAKARKADWIGGVPTSRDLLAIDRQIAHERGMTLAEVQAVPSMLVAVD
ncbi:hypothetical protein [Frigidibacter sp. MR17.24]|uniref:hypothetical protein n=1 Tax=Frigidibacter sp. MR17.24 TaxID=3127345 RepID=UPI003012C005